MMKFKGMSKYKGLLAIGVLSLSLAGCSANNGAAPAQQVPAQEDAAQAQVVQTQADVVEAAGKIVAKGSRNITLDFAASISSIVADEGQRVKKGDQLMVLDLKEISQQISNKESELNQLKLQLDVTNNSLATAQQELARQQNEYDRENNNNGSIELLQADAAYAQALLDRAKADLMNLQQLYDTQVISQTELEAGKRKVEDLEKTLNDKQLNLSNTKNTRTQTLDKLAAALNQQSSKVTELGLNIEIQKQKLGVTESDLARMKEKITKSYLKDGAITCDIDNGLVQQIGHVDGDYVMANSKLFNLVDMDSLVIEADVAEDFIKDVQIGATVEIYPLWDSEKTYAGHVTKIADMGVEKNGETFVQTEVTIDDMDELVKPNYSVDLRIHKDSAAQ